MTRSGSGVVTCNAPRAEKASGDKGSFVSNSILNETKVRETISGFDLCMSALRTVQCNARDLAFRFQSDYKQSTTTTVVASSYHYTVSFFQKL